MYLYCYLSYIYYFLEQVTFDIFSLVGECCKAQRVCVDQRIALCKSYLLLLLKSSETCGITNYDSRCRKDVVNRCLKFAWMAHCSWCLVERDSVSLSSAADSITLSLCTRQSSQLRSAPNLPVKMSHHRRPTGLLPVPHLAQLRSCVNSHSSGTV